MSHTVDRLDCDCGASFDFAENTGTTSRYVTYCPACGKPQAAFEIETVTIE